VIAEPGAEPAHAVREVPTLDGACTLLYDPEGPMGSHVVRLSHKHPEVLVMKRMLALAIGIGLVASPASAQVDQLLKSMGIGQQSGLSESKVSAGLKEALHVAAEKAVSLTGRPNGYFGDAAIKILMPEKLKTMQEGLRAVGYGPQVDAFVLSMNRAAEQAAPAAKQIFTGAVTSMSFDDAKGTAIAPPHHDVGSKPRTERRLSTPQLPARNMVGGLN